MEWDPAKYWDIEFNPSNNFGGVRAEVERLRVRRISLEKSLQKATDASNISQLNKNLVEIKRIQEELETELAVRINYYVHERRRRCKDSPDYMRPHGCKRPAKVLHIKKYLG